MTSPFRALAASGGAVVGIVAGGLLGLLMARVAGHGESVADFGPAFGGVVGGALVTGVLGCIVSLWALRDPLAGSTALFTLPCYALVAWATSSLGDGSGRWLSLWELTLMAVVYVVVPMAAPAASYALAIVAGRDR